MIRVGLLLPLTLPGSLSRLAVFSNIPIMKNFSIIVLFFALVFLPISAWTQTAEFPGVQKAMSPQEYDAAGLQKLTADERARLDEFIRRFVASSNQVAAEKAVDRAVKERKVTPPEIIQSRIVGPFTGFSGTTVFTLENGQRWRQSQPDSRYFPKVESPPVIIVKDTIGYRMYVAGGGDVRVSRVR
jgi:hypothetical protein